MLMERSKESRFQPVEIGKVEGRRAVIEAVEEEMTAFGGVPMLLAVERKVGLIAELSELVEDGRKQHLVEHGKSDVMLQRACQIAAGFSTKYL